MRLSKHYLIGFSLLFYLLSSREACAAGLDLHAHMFIEQGVPAWFYRGCFTCPVEASDWGSLRSARANEETLKASKLDIVVASLHAVSFGFRDLKSSIRDQIQSAEDFVKRNPSWVIARSAREARAALKQKRQVLVLSLEGAHGVLESDEDIRVFVAEGPISIVTPLHLTDDEFGGAAFLWSYRGFLNFWPFTKSLFNPVRIEGVRSNARGLTARGEWLVAKLLGAGAWIDLTHASDRAQMSMISSIKKFKHPLLYTHTVVREYHGAERGLAQWQVEEMKSMGGMVGLLPSRNYLNDTPGLNGARCDLRDFAFQIRKLAQTIGANAVTLGSDFNAPLEHLAPGCGTKHKLDEAGFWRQDQIQDLWGFVNQEQPGLVDPAAQVEKFLKLWEQVR